MKSDVRLAMLQSKMRKQDRKVTNDLRRQESERRFARLPGDLRRRITAIILVNRHGYSAAQLEHHFGWSREEAGAWIEAGKPLA